MSATAFHYPNRHSTLYQPEPIREDFALWADYGVCSTARQRNIWLSSFNSAHLGDAAFPLTGLIATPNHNTILQIPIACSQS